MQNRVFCINKTEIRNGLLQNLRNEENRSAAIHPDLDLRTNEELQGTQCSHVYKRNFIQGYFQPLREFYHFLIKPSKRYSEKYVFKTHFFPSWLAEICLKMPFVISLQGYSPDHLSYVTCTFLFIFLLSKTIFMPKSRFPAVVLQWW